MFLARKVLIDLLEKKSERRREDPSPEDVYLNRQTVHHKLLELAPKMARMTHTLNISTIQIDTNIIKKYLFFIQQLIYR